MEYYEVIVRGHLNKKRFLMFAEMDVILLDNGRTILTGKLDQAGLFAILNYIRDMGVKLLSVKIINKRG